MNQIDFFQLMYQFCEGMIEVRALPSGQRAFFDIGDHGAIDEFCSEHQDENLFFGVGTRDGNGGTKENIVHIPAVWCDIDFKNTPREVAREKLSQFPFKPSIIIKSGGGVHAYWFLKEPAEKSDLGAIEDVNKRIAVTLGGDMAATDAARIMRVPGTTNHKYNPPRKCELIQQNDFFYSIEDFQEILPPLEAKKPDQPQGNDTEWLAKAMQGCSEGQRNATAAKLAGYWINKLPKADVLQILHAWNILNTPPLEEKEIQSILKSVARYEPEKSQKRVDISNVYDAGRMAESYLEYIKSLKQNRLQLGIKQIDTLIRGVSGGEVLTIFARAGSYKTAELQTVLQGYVQNSSLGAVFFSIEMPVAAVTERYMQMIFEEPGSEIEAMFTDNSEPEVCQRVINKFKANMKNLFIVPVKVSLSDIPAYVRLIESEHNIKIGVIGVDYLGLLDGPGHNEYEVVSRLAVGMKHTAKLLNLPVIVLSQVSRKGGNGDTEISLDMGRGSGAIEEGADFVLGLWQNDLSNQIVEHKQLICKILKNRKGPAGSSWILDLDRKTFRIGPEARPYTPPKTKRM
ncbi:primase C-terminal domain-containing protein [Desulfobacterales bacterium]|nr:primase C-terminal domain-containing protein [Desulfobacterales bacterium]